MLWILASLLAALGLYVLLIQRSLASWLIGSQLIVLSLMSFFVHVGFVRDEMTEIPLGALYLAVLGGTSVCVLLGLLVRQFLLARDVGVDRMESE